jgi:hypothetical protein
MGRRGKKSGLLKAKNYKLVSKKREVAVVPREPGSSGSFRRSRNGRISSVYANLYIQAGGGLGDLIYHYLVNDSWKYVGGIKQLYPNVSITAVINTHNPDNKQLLVTNPNISQAYYYPWYPPGHSDEFGWKEKIPGYDLFEWVKGKDIERMDNQVWLLDSERKFLDSLTDRKYVVIHPFSGLPHRGCLPHPLDGQYRCYPDYKYMETANYLAEAGYLVKIIGHTPTVGLRKGRQESIVPSKNVHPNVDILTNRLSLRQNVELVRRADGFLGSHSSMLIAAWTNQVPSIFFYPGWADDGGRRSVREYGGANTTWCIDEPWTDFFELRASEFLELDSRIPANRLIELMNFYR